MTKLLFSTSVCIAAVMMMAGTAQAASYAAEFTTWSGQDLDSWSPVVESGGDPLGMGGGVPGASNHDFHIGFFNRGLMDDGFLLDLEFVWVCDVCGSDVLSPNSDCVFLDHIK